MKYGKLISNLRALMEATGSELVAASDQKSKVKSKPLTFYYKSISPDRNGDAETFWKIPSASERGKFHNVYITLIPQNGTNLFTVIQSGSFNARQKHTLIANSDVKCFCSCKKFLYYGMAHNLDSKHSIAEDHQSEAGANADYHIAPDRNDPDRKSVLCQHVIAAMTGMKMNVYKIVSDAKKVKITAAPQPTMPQNAPQPAVSAPQQAQVPGNDSAPDMVSTANADVTGSKEDIISTPNAATSSSPAKTMVDTPEDGDTKKLQEAALENLGRAAESIENGLMPEGADQVVYTSDTQSAPDIITEPTVNENSSPLPMSDIEDVVDSDLFKQEPDDMV